MSDVPLGAYLSGGLDSSLMVAEMARRLSEPLRTYSIGFDTPGYDESSYAELVSRHCGTRHTALFASPGDHADRLEQMIAHRDQPLSIPHEVALFQLSKEIRKHVTVCLSGEGADEVFGGYGRVQRSPMDYRKLAVYRRLPVPFRRLARLSIVRGEEFTQRLGVKDEVDHLFHVYHWWEADAKRALFTPDAWAAVGDDVELRQTLHHLFAKRHKRDAYDRVFYFFQKVHLVNLLERLDAQSMSASVEARVPFVDHRLVEFVSGIPLSYKMRWKSPWHQLRGLWTSSERASENLDIPKYLLRRMAATELPSAVAERAKLGFPVPLDYWLAGSLRSFAREILLDDRTKARGVFDCRRIESLLTTADEARFDFHGKRIWMLINVELWFCAHIDGGGRHLGAPPVARDKALHDTTSIDGGDS